MSANSSLLSVQNVTVRFGGLTAVKDVSIEVAKGSITAVIGPNGAGKTTLFNAITGVYEPTEGSVLVSGRDPQRPLTNAVIAGAVSTGLATGLFLCLLVRVEVIWRASIIDLYVFQQPFPWMKSIGVFVASLFGGGIVGTWLPLAWCSESQVAWSSGRARVGLLMWWPALVSLALSRTSACSPNSRW